MESSRKLGSSRWMILLWALDDTFVDVGIFALVDKIADDGMFASDARFADVKMFAVEGV